MDWFDGVNNFADGARYTGQKGIVSMYRLYSEMTVGTILSSSELENGKTSFLAVGNGCMGFRKDARVSGYSVFGSSDSWTLYKPFGDYTIGGASSMVSSIRYYYDSSRFYGYLTTACKRVFVFFADTVDPNELMTIDPADLLV